MIQTGAGRFRELELSRRRIAQALGAVAVALVLGAASSALAAPDQDGDQANTPGQGFQGAKSAKEDRDKKNAPADAGKTKDAPKPARMPGLRTSAERSEDTEITSANAALTFLESLPGELPGGGRLTVSGTLPAVTIESAGGDGPMRRVLIVAGIDGRAAAGTEALLRLVRDWRTKGLPKALATRRLTLTIIPMLNHEGMALPAASHRGPGQREPITGTGRETDDAGVKLTEDLVALRSERSARLLRLLPGQDVIIELTTTFGRGGKPALRWIAPAVEPGLESAVEVKLAGGLGGLATASAEQQADPRSMSGAAALRGVLGVTAAVAAGEPFAERIAQSRSLTERLVELFSASPAVVRSNPDGDAAARWIVLGAESRLLSMAAERGFPIRRLMSDARLRVEVTRVARVRPFSVQTESLLRTVKAGAFVIALPDSGVALARALIDPNAPHGLRAVGALDHHLRVGRELPVLRVVQEAGRAPLPLGEAKPELWRGRLELDLEQLFGPEGRVRFSSQTRVGRWSAPGVLERESGGRILAERVLTGEARVVLNRRDLSRALKRQPGVTDEQARQFARARVVDRCRAAGGATGVGLFLLRFLDDLYVWNADRKRLRRLTSDPAKERVARFDPKGRFVSFVKAHDLYVFGLSDGELRRLTRDGSEQRRNGILDWVYQEELYGRGDFEGAWWSPDGTRIAFLTLDETGVQRYPVVRHLPVESELEMTPWPKAGATLPKVSLSVVDVFSGALRRIEAERQDELITRVSWHPDGATLLYHLQDRAQTWLELRAAPAGKAGRGRVALRETTGAWVRSLDQARFLDQNRFIWLSERSGHRHLYRASLAADAIEPVTRGEFSIGRVQHVDKAGTFALVTSTRDHPTENHLWRVDLTTGAMTRVTSTTGSHRVSVDPAGELFLDTVSALMRPPSVTLRRVDGSKVRDLAPDRSRVLEHYRFGRAEYKRLVLKDGGLIEGCVILPPDYTPEKTWPVLCTVYGGPGAQTVWNSWRGTSHLWHRLLAQEGIIIWAVDPRAAGPHGVRESWKTWKSLGTRELADIEESLDGLAKMVSIDPKRIGITGWSFGGTMSAFALTHSKRFRLGMAGAPVTDWRNYDAIYTERYMGLPQDNPDGYARASVVAAASKLHGHLLLMHGSNDDNVHLSNTLQLVAALQRAGKSEFELMLYPGNRHGIGSPGQRRHLYRLMTRTALRELGE